MGSYLSEPVKEKISNDEESSRLSYGSSSMQGWRISQEDSHNCIIDFDTGTSFFAVYDGHGGGEVAKYCSLNLPDCLRSTTEYKKGNIGQALEDAFLEFDAFLMKPEVLAELKHMAGIAVSDESDEDTQALHEEASLPLHEVLARYGAAKKVAPSPMLKAKKGPKNIDINGLPRLTEETEAASVSKDKDSKTVSSTVNGEVEVKSETKPTTSDVKIVQSSSDKNELENAGEPDNDVKIALSSKDKNLKTELVEAGCSSGVSKRKPPTKRGDCSLPTKSSSDEESEEDEEFKAKIKSPSTSLFSCSGEDDEDSSEEEEDSDEDSDESEEDESESDDEMEESFHSTEDEPGIDCGCTAVVAVLQKDQLYVANAGDSRCIVSRGGKAIELSFDHKPEDPLERRRIYAAGGRVHDGRVNGGLNLSRAIGDHTYKRNDELSAKEQMITALPDILTLTVDPKEDHFMVLACDGIWNLMSSQEVVDFVQERLKENTKLSTVCEELFDHCLAPDTSGDGTGCDNMTAIIVKFHNLECGSSKRKSDSITKTTGLGSDDQSEPQDSSSNSSKKRKVETTS